jgi:hypothetical protein
MPRRYPLPGGPSLKSGISTIANAISSTGKTSIGLTIVALRKGCSGPAGSFDPNDPLGDPEEFLARLPVRLCPPAGEKLLSFFCGLRTSVDGGETLHLGDQTFALSKNAFDTLTLAWLALYRGIVVECLVRLAHAFSGKIRSA